MMFVKDWIRPAGPASEMAGQNGELDPICGSVEYHDEMTEEFSSNLAPRLEYLKRKASDNAFQRLRTCPELVNGQTRYRTKLLWSVHYETTVFSTNRGMCGTKEDEEPDANRAALVDRTVAQQARTHLHNHLIVHRSQTPPLHRSSMPTRLRPSPRRSSRSTSTSRRTARRQIFSASSPGLPATSSLTSSICLLRSRTWRTQCACTMRSTIFTAASTTSRNRRHANSQSER